MSQPFSPTPRQLDVLRFVRGYQLATGGVTPTYREIAHSLRLFSKSNAHRLICGLEERGWLRRLPGRDRAIEILVPVTVPRAPDGAPLYFVPIDG